MERLQPFPGDISQEIEPKLMFLLLKFIQLEPLLNNLKTAL